MKNLRIIQRLTFFALLSVCITGWSQVGINTNSPDAALDIVSSNSGILIPRIELASATDNTSVVNPKGVALVAGTMVWNTGTGGLTPAGYYYWESNQWNMVTSTKQKQVHFGKFIINSDGTMDVTGIGFTPSSVEFIAVNRVQDYNDGAYKSDGTNTNDIRMAGGFTTGYAFDNGLSITQQVISNAFSGSSINNIGTFSSSSHCIAALFINNNGDPIHDNGTASNGADDEEGLVRASMQSFINYGFRLNVDRFLSPTTTSPDRTNSIVVIYKAYR